MPLLILGLIVFFACSWYIWRTTSLTGDCRWREDRKRAAEGESFFHCLSCGAEEQLPKGKQPRHCRRQQ